ncbi:coiled-coil domain-containing protein 89-like [Clavelina lepadiformis]|uniref:Coiled-coil domain-containing protein 89 n=1 Tax=Clavelina lepadiformis TaxID=159417 RepID=A0ABP0GT66_CLALP
MLEFDLEMASPTRTPKDLRNIIHTNNDESCGDVSNIEKLKELSSDDHSEAAMLRSRIEEQGKLICFLKQRADENYNRMKVLEEINKELELLRANALMESKEKTKTCQMLEKRFDELAENHEEMIKIKDEYKLRNHQLTMENKMLKEENKKLFSAAIEDRDAEILQLLAKLKDHEEKLEQSLQNNSHMQEELNYSEQRNEVNEKKHINEMHELQSKLDLALSDLKSQRFNDNKKTTDSMNALQQLKKEKDSMLSQVMERGKLLQEKQSEIEQMKTEIVNKDRQYHDLQSDFAQKQDRVNANLRVQRLQAEKDRIEAEVSKLKIEFEAFRIHSNKLLTQERDLNAKLRNNVFVG